MVVERIGLHVEYILVSLYSSILEGGPAFNYSVKGFFGAFTTPHIKKNQVISSQFFFHQICLQSCLFVKLVVY